MTKPTISNRCVFLTLHGIGRPLADSFKEPFDEEMWVSREVFEHILDHANDGVQITFDDGFLSCWEVAFPELQRRGFVVRLFVTVGLLQQKGYLTKDHLREMRKAGMIIGSHGMCHRRWRRLDARSLDEEIFQAKAQLEDILGEEVTEAACPFGRYDRATLRALRQANFRRVYTSDAVPANPDDWLIPRYTIRASHTLHHIERIVVGQKQRVSWLRRARLLMKQWR